MRTHPEPGCAPARDSARSGCTPSRDGLSVVPLSQVVEVAETRAALRHQVFGGLVEPLLLLRVGWQAISRSHLVATPRRSLDQVLLPSTARHAPPNVGTNGPAGGDSVL